MVMRLRDWTSNFERNLNNTNCGYSINPNGTIKILNKDDNTKTDEWKSAIGKARFVKDENVAMLKIEKGFRYS